ncbi:MAG TPA: hypothetical protein PL158_09440, partial [Bacillota bacterium]|nr:hypothetical protein [Bacillota bacterium]
MNRKLEFGLGAVTVITCLLLCLFFYTPVALAQELSGSIITKIVASANTDTNYPALNLLDNDPATFWKVQSGNEGWVEFSFNEARLVQGLELQGSLSPDSELLVEYYDDSEWSQFTGGSYRIIPNEVIDLSLDRVVTSKLRIRLVGSGIVSSQLSMAKILTQDLRTILHRINPRFIQQSENTSPFNQGNLLIDGNTYTYWLANVRHENGDESLLKSIEEYLKPTELDKSPNRMLGNQGYVIFDFAEIKQIYNVNIFFTSESKGKVLVESIENDNWKVIGQLEDPQRSGWVRLGFDTPVITSKIRLVAETSTDGPVGGISEVEFWGFGNYQGYKHQKLEFNKSQTVINRSFQLKQQLVQDYQLDLVLDSVDANLAMIQLTLNGREYLADRVAKVNGLTVYRLHLTEEMLSDDINFLQLIPPLNASVAAIKITNVADGVQQHATAGLNNQLLLTVANNVPTQLIKLNQKTLVEQIEIYKAKDNDGIIELYYNDGVNWLPLDSNTVESGVIRFETPIVTDQFEIRNYSGVSINEVRILGSAITDHAPIVKLLNYKESELINSLDLNNKFLVGFVDNPEATVKINGIVASKVGHYFGVSLSSLQLNREGKSEIEVVAADPQGRETKIRQTVFIDQAPWFVMDQSDTVVYTNKTTYMVRGELKKSNAVIKINGEVVTERTGRFRHEVKLVDGLNLIKVECISKDQNHQGFVQTACRRVVHYSDKVQLQINSPLSETWINSRTVVITGTVIGLGETKVWVNGKLATVADGRFSFQVGLVRGQNKITIKAEDSRGEPVTTELTVWSDISAPKLKVVSRVDDMIFKTNLVEVTGIVEDELIAAVTVNDVVAKLSGKSFNSTISLSEGLNKVVIRAWDAAGNETQEIIDVIVDTTPPEPFEIKVETGGIQPILIFETNDSGSGVKDYWVSIDNEDWSGPIVSPYRTESDLSEGEHTVRIKATDNAGWETVATTKLTIGSNLVKPPINIRAIPGNKKILVKWEAPADNIAEYRIERQSGSESLNRTTTNTEIEDLNLINGVVYRYRVWAIDQNGNQSQPSDWVEAIVGVAEVAYDEQGAVIEYDNVMLIIPGTGLPEGVDRIGITEIVSEQMQERAIFPIVSAIYEFSAYKAGETKPMAAVTMEQGFLGKITYDPSKIPAGFPEQNLGVYYYDPMFDRWFQVRASGVDVKTNTIYFHTNHFTAFAVQANVIQEVSPQELKDAGYSPLKSYSQHGGINVSPSGGTVSTQVTELVLPGKNGFDLVLTRNYDTVAARQDAFAIAVSAVTGFNLVKGNTFASLEALTETINNWNILEQWSHSLFFDNVMNYVEKYLYEQGNYGTSMGQGWHLNLPYLENTNTSFNIVTSSGTRHSINEMEIVDLPVGIGINIGDNATKVRYVRFRQHNGEDFTLDVAQVYRELDIKSIINIKQDGSSSITDSIIDTTERIVNRHRWCGIAYKLTMKDGTVYELDGSGRTTKIIDPSGLNEIKIVYNGRKIDYIEDSMGRIIRFDYKSGVISPSIKRIWVENDPYQREINYTLDSAHRLLEAKDAGGRTSKYQYDTKIMYCTDVNATVNFVSIISKYVAQTANPIIAWIISELAAEKDVVLQANLQAQLVFPLKEVEAPGQGLITIDYAQENYMNFYHDVEWVSIFPVELKFGLKVDQRLYAKKVEVRPERDLPVLKTVTYDYKVDAGLFDQACVTEVVEDDGNRKTVYKFSKITKAQHHWEDHYVDIGDVVGISFWFPIRTSNYVDLPLNTETEIRDSRSNKLLVRYTTKYDPDNMRPTEKTTWHGNNYQRLTYHYDNWGNITYVEDYSVSNGRTNQSQTWMYYYNTSSKPEPSVPWLDSPYQVTNAGSHRYDLLLGKVIANYIPTVDGKTQVQYLHSFYNYNELGQLVGNAVWNGKEWLLSEFKYHPVHGSITSKINPEGHQTVYEYDDHGLLTAVIEKDVIDADGKKSDIVTRMGYEYISGWKLWDKNPRGYVIEYQYDSLGRITKIVAPDDNDQTDWIPVLGGECPAFRQDNPVTLIDYDDQELASTVTDPLGRHVIYDFNTFGQLVKIEKDQRDREGNYLEPNVTSIHYDAWGNIFKIVNPNGYTGSIERATIRYEYDALGRNTKIIYPDETIALEDNPYVEFQFDYDTNKLTIIDERKDRIEEEHDMQGRVIRRLQYNKDEIIESKVYYDGLGNEVIIIAPPKQGVTVKTYNELNLLTKVELPAETVWEDDKEVTVVPYQRFEYNKVGGKVAEYINTAKGEQPISYGLDGLGRVISVTTSVTDQGETKQAITKTYYDPNGNKVRVVDANNSQLDPKDQKFYEYTYTAMDLVRSEIDPLGNKTVYDYDPVGNRTMMTDPRGNSGKYQGDFTIVYIYDDLNRLIEGHLPMSPGETAKPVVKLKYDQYGNLLEREEPDGSKTVYTYYPRHWVHTVTTVGKDKQYTTTYNYDAKGNQTEIIDTRGYKTVKEYDALQRVTKIVYPELNSESFEYDTNNNLQIYKDGLFNETVYQYDRYNRLVSVKNAKDGVTSYGYDRWGNMTRMVNPLGHTYRYQYDELNRLILERNSQGFETHYRYDLAGNRVWSKDPNGTVSVYQYYPNNLLEKIVLKNSDTTQELQYRYDEAGYRKEVSNGVVITRYNYYNDEYVPNPFGRIYRESKTFRSRTYNVDYQYDVSGRLRGIKYPTGHWVNYEYNDLGQLIKVPGYIDQEPEYDQGGLLKSVQAANGVTTAYQFDKNGRLTLLSYNNQAKILKEYNYQYDAANNLRFKNEDEYRYDKLNQLIFARIKGKFEAESDENFEVGRALKDLQGQKPLEFSIDQLEVIELDYAAGSIGVDLQAPVPVSRVRLTPQSPIHRVTTPESLAVYISQDNSTYTKVTGWQLAAGKDGVLELVLAQPVKARYLKVKSYFDDRDLDYETVNKAEFVNVAQEIIKVYYQTDYRQEEYVYDAGGNRDTETITYNRPVTRKYEYYPDSNRLKSNEKFIFEYDNNGNLIKKSAINGELVWEYQYDLLNRLTKVFKNGEPVAEYLYDESGLRLQKTGSQGAVYYVFDQEGNLLYEEKDSEYSEYVYIFGKHFARVDGNLDNPEQFKKYFYHT